MPPLFVDAVGKCLNRLPADDELMTSVDLRDQAELAASCFQRFVEAEVQPSGNAVGFRTPVTAPVLGHYVAEKDGNSDAAAKAAMSAAIAESFALAWIHAATGEPEVMTERTGEDLWNYWVGYVTTQGKIEQFGIDEPHAQKVREHSRDVLYSSLREAKLIKRRHSAKIKILGMHYGQWGFCLRLSQTRLIEDDEFYDVDRQPPWLEATPYRPARAT